MRPAAPEVPLVAIRVRFLPAPRRRREHRAEHAQVDLPEPGPLLEAARTQYDRREEDDEVREVELLADQNGRGAQWCSHDRAF